MKLYSFPFSECPIPDGEPAPITKWWRRFIKPVNDKLNEFDNDDTGWLSPSLINSWVTPAAAGFSATLAAPAYRRRNGYVYLRGAICNGSASTIAFTLPDDCCPKYDKIFLTQGFNGPIRVDIQSGNADFGSNTGSFIVRPAFMTGGTTFVTLDGVWWPVYTGVQ